MGRRFAPIGGEVCSSVGVLLCVSMRQAILDERMKSPPTDVVELLGGMRYKPRTLQTSGGDEDDDEEATLRLFAAMVRRSSSGGSVVCSIGIWGVGNATALGSRPAALHAAHLHV